MANLEADPGLIFYFMGEQEKLPKTAQYPLPWFGLWLTHTPIRVLDAGMREEELGGRDRLSKLPGTKEFDTARSTLGKAKKVSPLAQGLSQDCQITYLEINVKLK